MCQQWLRAFSRTLLVCDSRAFLLYNFHSDFSSFVTLSANLWTRLGSASKTQEKAPDKAEKSAVSPEEEDSELQRAWGALIKEKEQSRQKKSRLDNLPSLQIEISRESSSGSDTESWQPLAFSEAWWHCRWPQSGKSGPRSCAVWNAWSCFIYSVVEETLAEGGGVFPWKPSRAVLWGGKLLCPLYFHRLSFLRGRKRFQPPPPQTWYSSC